MFKNPAVCPLASCIALMVRTDAVHQRPANTGWQSLILAKRNGFGRVDRLAIHAIHRTDAHLASRRPRIRSHGRKEWQASQVSGVIASSDRTLLCDGPRPCAGNVFIGLWHDDQGNGKKRQASASQAIYITTTSDRFHRTGGRVYRRHVDRR